ncbi:carbon-nitrogen hydrolase family protein [Microlunatus aurantiacus]|uniref:Carbon-nitrogen hydrolase family protein n=1 Tax=Microlunatus aurantiacus TaxID=446786 RepID=A0ABP7DHT5_9ACTN
MPTTSPTSLRLAVAQTTHHTDPRDTEALRALGVEIRALMHQASVAGADLIQFPEGTLCFPDKRLLSRDPDQLSEADWTRFPWLVLDDEIIRIRALAAKLRLWTVLGAQQRAGSDRGGDGGRPTTSLLIIDPAGEVVGRYDERILSRSKQAYLYAAGTESVVIEVNGLRLGFTSGLEVLFPALFSDYEEQGVDAVLFSTAGPADPAEADSLSSSARTHALQCGLWVGYAVPSDKAPYAAAGILAPGGEWVARCPDEAIPAIAVADVTPRPEHPGRTWRRTMLQALAD